MSNETSKLARREFLASTLVSAGGMAIAGPALAAEPKTTNAQIRGHADAAFAAVRKAFRRNFAELGELGGSVCVTIDGKEVLHLWGGFEDLGETRPWHRDTLVQPASSVKGYFPFCVHKLVADGLVEYDQKVGHYWPEFATNGKEYTTVRHLLSHMACLEKTFPINVYATPLEQLLPVMESAVPAAEPGSYGAYHSQTFMPLIAGLVYKVTGEEIYSYFRREVAAPWGIDAWLSLPASEFVRSSDYVIPTGSSYYPLVAAQLPASMRGQPMVSPPITGFLSPYTNARAYARIYGAVASGGALDGVRLFPESIAAQMGEVQWTNEHWVRQSEFHEDGETFGTSLQSGTMGWLSNGIDVPLGPNKGTYGMPGAGGSVGFADPEAKLGFGYTINSWHEFGDGLGPRLAALVDAVFESLN